MRRRAKKGEVMQRRPYGYKRPGPRGEVPSGVTEIDPVARKHIDELFRRYVEDEESLVHLLNKAGDGYARARPPVLCARRNCP
jgi:hypothetical protein